MIKKKVMIILIAAMIMICSLTACQKTGDETESSDWQRERTVEKTTVETEISGTEQETIPQGNADLLAFLTDSPEYKASEEWREFDDGYDTDFAILEQVGNEPVDPDYEYEAYCCYSPEMEEKIEEICEKYGLTKLSGFRIVDDYNDLCSKAGIGDFCERASENVKQTILSSYMYDGAFLMEGIAALAGSSIHEVSYQFSRVVKGYFTSAYLDFGDLTECNVRAYTTKKGENVFFANITNEGWGEKIYIIADREKSFIVINVLGDMSSDITDVNDERLELLADAFDFTAIP
ncbi:MAG: hypothetical protein HDR05_16560 [Lachnospiraceae bacterium]|nr:hypothetical protein [Lachnospiraceae bacterium]